MFSEKRAKILTVKIKHNKNNNNKKAICCLEGLTLAKEIYAFKIIVLAMVFKKKVNLKLKSTLLPLFLAVSILPLKSGCHCFSGRTAEGPLGRARG